MKPAERKEETLTPVIMDGPPAIQYQSRIPFDFNYYGDFYFTSMTDRAIRIREIRFAKTGRAIHKPGRRGGKMVSYQRTGPFRFMDLPTEVRTITFQLLASVILHLDPESKTFINSISIGRGSIWKSEYKETYGMGFEKWLENMDAFRRQFLSKKEAKQYSVFVKEANEFVYIHEDHPNRNGYYMGNFNVDHASMPDSDFLDWVDLN
ncbi:uncharacterized protein EAF01_001990 [Botrytis porri]|uniref:uncharacterized protein n=1 Tax=Botrytis porri TaxID=87229 RepID=UPI001901F82F|nr:uncharacterized protein EAF01_001990 [Botrytis porri]KAF7912969.1 hypothetical protein EAF01_001990 [Botrytis porri]